MVFVLALPLCKLRYIYLSSHLSLVAYVEYKCVLCVGFQV